MIPDPNTTYELCTFCQLNPSKEDTMKNMQWIKEAMVARDVNNSWNTLTIVTDLPTSILTEDIRFVKITNNRGFVYYGVSEQTGLVRQYFHTPTNQTGFGGHVFDLEMADGSIAEVKGPWSGSPDSLFEDTGIKTDDIQLVSEGMRLHYAMDFESIQQVLDAHCPGWEVTWPTNGYNRITTYDESTAMPYEDMIARTRNV